MFPYDFPRHLEVQHWSKYVITYFSDECQTQGFNSYFISLCFQFSSPFSSSLLIKASSNVLLWWMSDPKLQLLSRFHMFLIFLVILKLCAHWRLFWPSTILCVRCKALGCYYVLLGFQSYSPSSSSVKIKDYSSNSLSYDSHTRFLFSIPKADVIHHFVDHYWSVIGYHFAILITFRAVSQPRFQLLHNPSMGSKGICLFINLFIFAFILK